MLKEALKARLPLITCHTSDLIHARRVLAALSGAATIGKPGKTVGRKTHGQTHKYSMAVGGIDGEYEDVYARNLENEDCLVVVNPTERVMESFHAGEMPVPANMMQKLLRTFLPPKVAKALIPSVNGLTLLQVSDLCRLSQSSYGEITAETISGLRSSVVSTVPGVQIVSTDIPHYYLEESVDEWLQDIGPFLLSSSIDSRLRPRGLLMSGHPGTGKTLSSKYIASVLGVPLYRLDIGAIQSKYVGESEANLRRALDVISRNDPCIMLIDEVEKLFFGTDDSGVTKNLLAGLLWWLQEHDTRVLTLMTTNDLAALPKELVRPGRIDQVVSFHGCQEPESFVNDLVDTLGIKGFKFDFGADLGSLESGYVQADITQLVIEQARRFLKKKA